MMVPKKHIRTLGATTRRALVQCALLCFSFASGLASAQENAIESISANQQGANVVIKVGLKNPVAKAPVGFSITSPARIALDFALTSNATGKTTQEIGLGDVRNVNVVQAGERSLAQPDAGRCVSGGDE